LEFKESNIVFYFCLQHMHFCGPGKYVLIGSVVRFLSFEHLEIKVNAI
jgi:hypothetical protein